MVVPTQLNHACPKLSVTSDAPHSVILHIVGRGPFQPYGNNIQTKPEIVHGIGNHVDLDPFIFKLTPMLGGDWDFCG